MIALLASQNSHAASCPSIGPVAANAKTDVVYDPIDSTMKACVAGTWLTMSGGGGGGGNLDGLTDVVITTPSTNQALVYNGAAWVNATLSLTETDPKVGALTGNKWCSANAGGTAIVCNQNAPAAGASSSGTAGYVQLSDGAGGFTTSGSTAGQELFWDGGNKRLGVGTSTPGSTLSATGPATEISPLRVTGANADTRIRIGNQTASSTANSAGIDLAVMSSTQERSAALLQASFTNTTDATRTAQLAFNIMNNGAFSTPLLLSAGSVNIGGGIPDASAVLDVASTTKGFLPPRMTTAEVTAVATPADGLLVYDTDTDTIKLRANGAWVSLQAGGAESDPQVGTLTATKWCAANAGGTAIDCTADAPATGATGSGSEVQFRNSSTGAFAADPNFVWDSTNTRLGVGTSSPGLAAGAGRSYLSVKGVSEGGILELIQAGTDADAATIGGIQFATDNNTNGTNGKRSAAIFSRQSGATANDRGGNLQFWTKADSGLLNLAMTITDAANAGVGTATPQARLDVAGGARVGTDAVCTVAKAGMLAWNSNTLQVCTDAGTFTSIASSAGGSSQWSNGASSAIYYNGGNVGVGTIAPGYPLTVATGSGQYTTGISILPSTHSTSRRSAIALDDWLLLQDATGNGTKDFSIYQGSSAAHRLFITTAGNVGIGTAGPTSRLHVDGTGTLLQLTSSGFGSLYAGSDVNYPWFGTPANHDLRLVTNGTERVRITSAGNVGIGTSGPGAKLDVQTATGPSTDAMRVISGSSAAVWTAPHVGAGSWNGISQAGDQGIYFHGAGGIGTGNLVIAPWAAATSGIRITSGGNLTVYGATTTCTLGNGSGATNCTSDGRLKDRVEPLTSALDKLSDIHPVTFHWKDKTKDQREFLGLIAQDVEEVYPQAVSEVSDTAIGTAKTLDYAVMVVPAIAAIKELKAANDNLSRESAHLRTENAQLRDALEQLSHRVDQLEYAK